MHSVKELKRQYEDALGKYRVVKNNMLDKKDAYHGRLIKDKASEFESMGGVFGVTKVRDAGVYHPYDGEFIVKSVEVCSIWERAEYVLAHINNDGTMSKRPSRKHTTMIEVIE